MDADGNLVGGEPTATELTAVNVTEIATPALDGSVPKTAVVACEPAAGAPTEATVTWKKGADAFTDATFTEAATYTATYSIDLTADFTLAANAKVMLGAAEVTPKTEGTVLSFTKEYVIEAAPAATDITGAQAIAITAPVTDGEPQATVTATDEYTGAITWTGKLAEGKFGPETAYTANVTLTSKEGYKFAASGVTATVEGATSVSAVEIKGGDVSGNTAAFTATFAATEPLPVDPVAPEFAALPGTLKVMPNAVLKVTASAAVTDEGAVSYQWYSNSKASTEGAAKVEGATTATLTVPTATSGTAYYYCVATNTLGEKTATANSSFVKVVVYPAIPDSDFFKMIVRVADGAMGAVSVQKPDGTTVTGAELVKDALVRLTAEANPGYRFVKWVRTPLTTPASLESGSMESYAFEDTATEYTDPVLTVQLSEASQYEAQFESYSAAAEDKLQLSNLTVTLPNYSKLIQKTEQTADFFAPGVLEYDLYVKSGDASVSLMPYIQSAVPNGFDPAKDKVLVNNTEVTMVATTNPNGSKTYAPAAAVAVALTDGRPDTKITIEIKKDTNGTLAVTNTYTVNVHRLAADPHIILNVAKDKNAGEYKLELALQNTSFTSGSFELKLDTTKDLTGFFNSTYATELTALTNGVGDLMTDNFYTEGSDAVLLTDATFDNTTKTLRVSFATVDDKPLVVTGERAVLGTFYFKANSAKVHTADEAKKGLSITADSKFNSLYDTRFLNFFDTVPNKDTSVILILAEGSFDLMGFVNTYMGAVKPASAVERTVIDVLNDKGVSILGDTKGKVSTVGEFVVTVPAGEYTLVIEIPGYKKLEVTNIKVEAADYYIGAKNPVAGDVNKDGVVDAADRAALISAMFDAVNKDDSFAATVDTAKVYGDLDGDGYITAADLGYLLSGFGN